MNLGSKTKIILACLFILTLLTGCVLPDLPTSESQIVILWHSFTGSEADALQVLTDRFNEDNPWSIVLISEYQRDIVDKLAQTSSEHHPDLVLIWPEDLPVYMNQGFTVALQDLLVRLRAERSDLLPMATGLYTVRGNLQAAPLGLATHLLYYNVDWLSDLGYSADQATWEDVQRAVCAATDPLAGQLGLGLPANAGTLLALLTSGGAAIVGEDDVTYQFADEAGIRVADSLNDILGGTCGFVYDDLDAGLTRLSNSSIAMIVESSLRLPDVVQAVIEGRNFSLGVSALPGEAGAGRTLWYGPGIMLIASDAARQDAALNVMMWFLSPGAQETWSAMTDYLPVRRSLVEARLIAGQVAPSEEPLLRITLQASEGGEWIAWPLYTNSMACRASLLRALLSLGGQSMPGAYINAAATACNTGIRRMP